MNHLLTKQRAGCGRILRSVCSTIIMCTRQRFDGNMLTVWGGYAIQIVQFVILMSVWRSLTAGGRAPGGMEYHQLVSYSLLSAILYQELNIISPATSSLWEGSVIGRFTRPVPVPVSFAAETIGKWWIPHFLLFGLPLLCISPLLGLNIFPASGEAGLLALFSLLLSISLGFAMDLLFAAFAMCLKNGCWAATQIREAAFGLLSGEMIPFVLFPSAIGRLFTLLPTGSVAYAPLAIYTGSAASPHMLIFLQLFWNIVLWIAAVHVFQKSKERMISFGG